MADCREVRPTRLRRLVDEALPQTGAPSKKLTVRCNYSFKRSCPISSLNPFVRPDMKYSILRLHCKQRTEGQLIALQTHTHTHTCEDGNRFVSRTIDTKTTTWHAYFKHDPFLKPPVCCRHINGISQGVVYISPV